MERSAKVRGTGIARRTPQSICKKIYEGKAVIALATGSEVRAEQSNDGKKTLTEDWVGFSYIEAWSDGQFVSNSGLIVNPAYRNKGMATAIKEHVFALARNRYPQAKIFSITTGAAILKMNHRLGFEPVTYTDITRDDKFWDQCRQCVHYPILEANRREKCLCTAMVFFPEEEKVGK